MCRGVEAGAGERERGPARAGGVCPGTDSQGTVPPVAMRISARLATSEIAASPVVDRHAPTGLHTLWVMDSFCNSTKGTVLRPGPHSSCRGGANGRPAAGGPVGGALGPGLSSCSAPLCPAVVSGPLVGTTSRHPHRKGALLPGDLQKVPRWKGRRWGRCSDGLEGGSRWDHPPGSTKAQPQVS